MAVVAEYQLKNCTVAIHDDAYEGISEAEMERRVREVQRTAWRIWESQKRRETKETGCRDSLRTVSQ